MLILINPLIKVRLQEVNLLGILQQSWPELLLELLLSQHHLDVLECVVDLALLLIDLSVEVEVDGVRSLQRLRVALEGQSLWFELQLEA